MVLFIIRKLPPKCGITQLAWLVQTNAFLESIQHGKYRNGNVEIIALAPKLAQVSCEEAFRI
jgi:hypothetical protein